MALITFKILTVFKNKTVLNTKVLLFQVHRNDVPI